jgi:hypothetical protein
MNERIRKLESQAWGQVKRTNGLVRTEDFNEKFAELIVRECAKIADDGCGSACFGLGINGQMLKEHFGVEND